MKPLKAWPMLVENRIVFHRRARLEVMSNGWHRLHLESLDGHPIETFEGKDQAEAEHKLDVYLAQYGGQRVHSDVVDQMDQDRLLKL